MYLWLISDAKELVAWMKGHESAIHTISIHASGRYALTSSGDTAQLWDLDTFQRKRKLNIKENVGITKVGHSTLESTSYFKIGSIFQMTFSINVKHTQFWNSLLLLEIYMIMRWECAPNKNLSLWDNAFLHCKTFYSSTHEMMCWYN